MLRFNPKEFIFVFTEFSDLSKQLEKISNLDQLLPPEVKNKITPALDQIELHCEMIGLGLSTVLISQIKREMKKDYKAISLKKFLDELKSRILDEINTSLLLSIKPDKVSFFENSIPFGQEVFDNFPSANFDIEEASSCFALARYTACVMHLQRVIEIGLKTYGKYLGVMDLLKSPSQPSWSEVLKRALDVSENRNKNKAWASTKEKDFCDGVYPFLFAVKNAWRNPCMHADKTYKADIAEDIFNATKGFMHYLAEHVNESGKLIVND